MKRLSLAQKINECLKHGTIRTYQRKDARNRLAECYGDTFEGFEDEVKKSMEGYENGKVLCYFKANDPDADLLSVLQTNTIPNFIKDVVYLMVSE